MWMFDNYRNRYPLRDRYLNYWGGRRAWWKHHGGRKDWKPGRPGGWPRGDRDDDGPRGTRPGRPDRKSGLEGKSVSVRVDIGGSRIIKTKNITTEQIQRHNLK